MNDKDESLDAMKESDDHYFEAVSIQNGSKPETQILLEKLLDLESDVYSLSQNLDDQVAALTKEIGDVRKQLNSLGEEIKKLNYTSNAILEKVEKLNPESSVLKTAERILSTKADSINDTLKDYLTTCETINKKGIVGINESIVSMDKKILEEIKTNDRNNLEKIYSILEKNSEKVLENNNILSKKLSSIHNEINASNSTSMTCVEESCENLLAKNNILVEKIGNTLKKYVELLENNNKNFLEKNLQNNILLEKNLKNNYDSIEKLIKQHSESNDLYADEIASLIVSADSSSQEDKLNLIIDNIKLLEENIKTSEKNILDNNFKNNNKNFLENNLENKKILEKIDYLEKLLNDLILYYGVG